MREKTQKDIEKVSQLYKVLSDPTRLKILFFLKTGEKKCHLNQSRSRHGTICCFTPIKIIKR